MTFSDADWLRILSGLGVRPTTAAEWAAPFADEVQPEKFSAGMADVVDWLPQILHECTMLECLEERLSYTPERICEVWPSRFPTLASALPYSHSPAKLANYVYANRMGNGPPESGDGWNCRGRSPIMATGANAYRHLSGLCGQDFMSVPDLLTQPHFGLQAAVRWWEGDIPDSMLSDQVALRRKVNGGNLGLPQVVALHEKLTEILA